MSFGFILSSLLDGWGGIFLCLEPIGIPAVIIYMIIEVYCLVDGAESSYAGQIWGYYQHKWAHRYTFSYLADDSEMLGDFWHLGNEFLDVWRKAGGTGFGGRIFGALRG